ncbi:hypothetical protein BDD12DRAFT_979887 [Trichophaea hybrida]|nr:hypothetical protein BDD12DRAFT_979887 [Trichophaea hybrida]
MTTYHLHSHSRAPSDYTMSQPTTQTATRYKNIPDARGAPPSPLDTVRGENGSDDEQESDSTRPRSQKHKLKRRSTTSGSREHSISREALSGSVRRLSGSTSRSSEHSRGDMFWENGGSVEEISAATMRKERKHREREKEQKNREETEPRSKDERERDRDRRDRRDEKREKRHHRNKSERERARTEKRREGLKSGSISIITTTDDNLQHANRISGTQQSSFHPMAIKIPPPPPPQPVLPPPPPPSHAYPEVRRRESQTISSPPPPTPAPAPPPNQIAPPSPPQSASGDHQSTPPPPAYAEMKLRENAAEITPPHSPPDEKKPALRSKAPSPVNTTITASSSSTAVTQLIPQAPASKAARRSLPPSPVAEKKNPDPQEQLQHSNTQPPAYQQHQPQPQRPPSSAQSNASTGTVCRTSLAPLKPVVAPIRTEQPQTRQRSLPVRISDPPPPLLQPSARISDPPPQLARISPAPNTRISDPIPIPPPQSEQTGPVPKRPQSPSPIESVAPEDSISPLVQAQPKRDYSPDHTIPQSAGPWSKPPSFQANPRTRTKRPHSFAMATYGSIEEDTLPTPRGSSHHIPRRASVSNPYPPQPYYQDHSGYSYPTQLPPPTYPTYDWNDPYAPSVGYAPPPPPPLPSLPRMEYESDYSHHHSRSDSFHYMGASPPPAPKPQPVPKLESVQMNVNRTGRRRRKSSPVEAAAGRSNREEIESDIDLEGGFCSDGSARGWTTMSVSRERTHSPTKKIEEETVEDVDDRDLREEHRDRMRKEKMELHQPEPQPQPEPEPEEEKEQPLPKPRVHIPKSIVIVSENAVSSPSESQSSSEEEEPEPWAVPQPEMSYPPANTGYPLVAKTIATSPNLQVYRRFSTLNHRVLLHMQDEISELSSMLDAFDAQAESAVKNRRGMTRTPHGERRLQILTTVACKIGQYNQAVKAYQDTLSIPPATSADTASFRTWLAENNPLVPEESTFLDEESDLMSLGRLSSLSPPPAPTPTPPPILPVKLDTFTTTTDLDPKATAATDSNTIPSSPAAKPFSPPVLSTSSLQGLTIAAILLAPMMQSDAPACACNDAVKTFNWGGFLLRSAMWVLALTPAVVSLIDRKGWWAFALVVLGLGGGLTLLSMT